MTRRVTLLWIAFALQAICCAFFLIDIAFDLFAPMQNMALAESDTVEAIITGALFVGLMGSGSELWRLQKRQKVLDAQLEIAKGAFSDVIQARFDDWDLTDAERDVAVLAIKGFSIAEMADLRSRSEGTIKAQCAQIYRKAEVSGRLQLISLFLKELFDDKLLPAQA